MKKIQQEDKVIKISEEKYKIMVIEDQEEKTLENIEDQLFNSPKFKLYNQLIKT
jgi:hypothetical protein